MKKTLVSLVIFMNLFCNAQTSTEKLLLEGGYIYFNKSFADVGLKYKFDENHLMLGANALIGESNGKLLLIPEINVTKYFNAKNFPFPFARLNVSPKTVTPQFGFSMLVAEMGLGYGFALDDASNYQTKGFRLSLNFNIPLNFK